jgi:dihydroorotate dehydrogenase (fumarate)
MYDIVADPDVASAAVETMIRDVVIELKRLTRLPLAIKLSPYFTAFGHLARDLDRAGAQGLVLFNRFYQADVDIDRLTTVPRLGLSSNSELLLRLRWIAILRPRLRISLALTGGVATPTDGIKALLVGADIVQLVSAILRHGIGYLSVMRQGLEHWMEGQHLNTLEEVRGRLCATPSSDSMLAERAAYIKSLQTQRLPT